MIPAEELKGGTKLYDFGGVDGGPRTVVKVYESGHIECFDITPAREVQEIIESVSALREQNARPRPPGKGMVGARIPITLWQAWRQEWQRFFTPYFTWQAFEARKLNSREFRHFNAMPGRGEIPTFRHQTGG